MRLRRRSQPKPKRRRIRKLRALVLVLVILLLSLVAFTYGLVTAIASDIPKLDPANQAKGLTRNGYIYASDGHTVLAVLRGEESRVVVRSDQIAPVMKQAIVAVEDRRFWEHRGVDLRGILRAVWADVAHKQLVQGGSTITQQFVKNTLPASDRTVSRKLKEAALAWQLERRWSKDRILTAYLNTIFFGNGAYGIQMAARVYFGKTAAELTLPEAALLAGIPSNPSLYDPVRNPPAAKKRRDVVLTLMRQQALISQHDLEKAEKTPLPDPDSVRLPGTRGLGGAYFAEYVKQQLLPYYGRDTLNGGGLRVKTSIDLRLQKLARSAIHRWLPSRTGPQAALVAIDPRDGRVLAMDGGPSFSQSQFNLAVQGERQSGSAFKPFVLATALDEGISPQTTYVSKPALINLGDKLWSVHNYENSYLGPIDLTKATTYSDNSVFAQLTAQVGPSHVAKMAHSLGITSRLHNYFGIGLGVEAVNPLEMARAFSTFANSGRRIDGSVLGDHPRAVLWVARNCDGVSKVASSKGCDGIDVNRPVQRRVLDENKAATLTSILQTVVTSGTGKRAALPDRPVAGKTGTTENYGDAWFVGYTPQLAVAVWVGYPKTLRPMLTEFENGPVAGGTYPALIWNSFAKGALRILGDEPESFTPPQYEPATPYTVVYRDNKWLLDNGNCRDTHQVMYVVGSEPTNRAACKPNEVDVPRVVGAKLADAIARIQGMPLTPEVLRRPAKPGERLGIVVAQKPTGGTLSSFDTMRIIVPHASGGAMPNLVGRTLTRARQILAKRGVTVAVAKTTEGPVGQVMAQDVSPGRAAVRGMTVKLVVGRG
ncbi:MAG TPA: PBP1A family penicillin-binding protein [Gaiellaceae bacterium]